MKFIQLHLLLLAVVCGSGMAAEADRKTNVLLIMADDMGYSDAGCYGGEIDTPGIDRLADEGIRFTRFRATPMCLTSRAALLSGMSFQDNGRGRYERVLPLPEAFRQSGYRTYLAGKWHAGDHHPVSPGFFDRFHGFLSGMTDCYSGGPDWYMDDKPFREFGGDFDATTRITDQSIAYMREAVERGQPFFVFVSYNAPHHPLQARRETYEKYLGRYRDGFQAVRERRLERQRAMGLINPEWQPAAPGPEIRRWDEMPPFRQEVEDMRMAAYAAMVDEMDQGIVRLLQFLDTENLADDTVVIFTSDNGGYFNNGDINRDHLQKPWQAGSNQTISNGWGWVQNTPFNLYKQTSHEGGLAVPFIVRWPKALADRAGQLSDLPAEIVDLYPTFADLTGFRYPAEHEGQALKPLTGKSFLPALTTGADFDPPPRFHWFSQSRAWIEGDDKVVSFHNGPWQLYDLARDRTEQNDLAAAKPELTERLSRAWHAHAEAAGAPPEQRLPAQKTQRAWGWHHLQMVLPGLARLFPDNGQLVEPGSTSLELQFNTPLQLSAAPDARISLHTVAADLEPVWQTRPTESCLSEDRKTLRFEQLPPLQPDTQYFVLLSRDAFRIGDRPAGPINDGAYWWRFRTKPE